MPSIAANRVTTTKLSRQRALYAGILMFGALTSTAGL